MSDRSEMNPPADEGRLDLSQVIVNTAKVEVDYLRATDGGESSFLSSAVGRRNLPPGLPNIKPRQALPNGIVGVRRHLLKDDPQ